MTTLIALDGQVYSAVPVGEDDRGCLRKDGTCCGCRAATGRDHREGCDWERCPRCGGQVIACDCSDFERPCWTPQQVLGMTGRLRPIALAEMPS